MTRIEKEYKEYTDTLGDIKCMKTSDLKKMLIEELTFLSAMSVEEYTLYRKWLEIKRRYPAKYKKVVSNDLFFEDKDNSSYPELDIIKNNIWYPSSPEDYLKLEPEVIWTMQQESYKTIWTKLRVFTSTMLDNSNIGRNLRFIILDKVTGKYLGVIGLSSDFMDLTPRDNYIGWSRDIKTKQKMINYTAIGSTIVPTQPLGFNYVGGKLLALLTISEPLEQAWNIRYKDKLIGITTTSLYGSFSQYNGLRYWKKMGHSAGSIKFEPCRKTVMEIRKWLNVHHIRKYWEWYEAKNDQGMPYKRDHKQRSLAYAYRQLKIDKKYFETSHERGIYFCKLYNNSEQFLRKEITEKDLVRRFDNSVESLTNIWKNKYAKNRLNGLLKNKRYNNEGLFYDDLIDMEWEEVKNKYIKDVGR